MVLFAIMIFVIFWCIGPAASKAEDPSQTLQFRVAPLIEPTELLGTARFIYADGVIDKDAPSRLRSLLKQDHIPDQSDIFLNSPGGDLLGGIELGRLIREHDLRTYIGAWPDVPLQRKRGVCLSACALTFLGGSFRFADNGVYGVHRFYALRSSPQDSDIAQILSAAIIQYIRDMGVDTKLFGYMTEVGKDEINVIPKKGLEELGVVNNGVGPTTWTIVSIKDGLYLRGVRDTAFGSQKLILACRGNGLGLMAVFDPQGHADEAVKMSAVSLLVDGHTIPIPYNKLDMKPTDNHGWIDVAVPIPAEILRQLKMAKTLGVTLQFTYEAAVFLGIGDMDFTTAARMLPGYLTSCR